MAEGRSEKDVAKMDAELTNIKELLLEVRNDIKNLNQTYIPRNETNVMFSQRDREIESLKEDLTEVKTDLQGQVNDIKADMKDSKRNLPNWISSVVAIGALITAFFK